MPDCGSAGAGLGVMVLQSQDIADCVDLVRRSFDQFSNDAAAIRHWFDARILNNPWQAESNGIGVGARDRGKLVAFRAMFAQPWWIGGRSAAIAFAAHTCIDPSYRGSGLGSRLIAASRLFSDITGSTSAGDITQQVYRKCGFVAVGGESNNFFRLRAGFTGSLQARLGRVPGWIAGSAMDALASDSLGRMGSARNFRLETVKACSGEFDELWLRARGGYVSCLERSSRYLNWRIFEFPTCPLSLVALRDLSGRLRGYGIWHELSYSRYVSCAVVRDLFVADDDDEALSALLVLIIRHLRRRGVTWVNLELASRRLTLLFESLGLEPIVSNGNRYHVHSQTALDSAVIDGWFRSGLDGDYFDTRPALPAPSKSKDA